MIIKSYTLENNPEIFKKLNNILFYGENFGLRDDFKKYILKFNSENKILKYSQNEILSNLSNFYNEVYNKSLFEEQKIFIISDVNDKMIDIIDRIRSSGENKFFFFCNQLEKKSKIRNYFEKENKLNIVPCYKDNETTLKNIIAKKLKSFQGLNNEITNLLIFSSSEDRNKLNIEIEKVKIFFKEKRINVTELTELLNIKEDDDFNNIKDSAIIGNCKKTNSFLNSTILDSEKTFFYISLLNKRFEMLKVLKNQKTNNIELALKELRPPIFWKDKPIFIQQSKKWDLRKLNQALEQTYIAEINIKSNNLLENKILMKKLLVDICNLANVA